MKGPILNKTFLHEVESTDNENKNKIKPIKAKTAEQLRFQKPQLNRNVPIQINSQNFIVKLFWTFIIFFSFIFIIRLGHVYLSFMILICNTVIFYEIMSYKRREDKDSKILHQEYLNWYFYTIAIIYSYGKVLQSKLPVFVIKFKSLFFYVKHQELICFILWFIGVLIFLKGLKKGYYKYQISMFGWTHMAMLLIVSSAAVIIINIYQGMIWFVFPCLLIIFNDISCYICGFFFGRTVLNNNVQKKTLEGTIGGFFMLLFISYYLSKYLQEMNFLICPQYELTMSPLPLEQDCELNQLFQVQYQFDIYELIPIEQFKNIIIEYSLFQYHVIFLSIFASLISVFSGKFASSIKRALNKNHYNHPDENYLGMFDRLDCQISMAMFCYLYLHQVILPSYSYVNSITNYISMLDLIDQVEIYKELQKIIEQRLIAQNSTLSEYIQDTVEQY